MIDQQYQDPAKVLISFTGKSWINKNTPGPDPKKAAAKALYFASDNIFDHLDFFRVKNIAPSIYLSNATQIFI